ncbi:DegT/DnrJ/EryC1/StrS family aminotransferase [Amycolatopsis minnesotensis]|uniref:Aminotransferase class I/II-fold pyridoxal phosphate-dependent enzyme n=1 Tax=Amycolatopsis minnesotensis TaxID=337894 RepID=A0ABP5BWX0_9PSEU
MTNGVGDLALFGGPPAFDRTRVVGRPRIGDRARFLDRLDKVLDSGWFTHNGPLVQEFERKVAETAGVGHCVLVTSATTALELMLDAAGVTGEVIMPSMTFIATAHSARVRGLQPVFCDIDPVTGCIDPDEVERLITPRTTAIAGVHLWGQPCAVDRLQKIADANGLFLYFDAAQALGSTFEDTPVGSFGSAEVFSFHATKVVNSFEGGAVVTNDGELAEKIRLRHKFGMNASGVVCREGTNAKMTEACAAMGLTSLEALEDSIRANIDRHADYRAALAGTPGIEVVEFNPAHHNNHQYLIIKVDHAENGLRRDTLLDLLRAENVFAQRYFSPCCHQLEPYRTENPVVLPRTEALAEQVIALPTGHAITTEDVTTISELITRAAVNGTELTRRREAVGVS